MVISGWSRIASSTLLLVLLVWAAAAATQDPHARPAASPAVTAIEEELAQHGGGPELEIARLLYEYNGYTPQWTSGEGPAAAGVFLQRLERAEEDGLCARSGQVESLRHALHRHDAARVQRGHHWSWENGLDLDVRLTLAISAYAWELHAGRDTSKADESRLGFVAATLAFARDSDAAGWALSRLEPAHPEYGALRTALHHYRALSAGSITVSVPDGMLLRRDETGNGELSPGEKKAVRAVFERLRAIGDLPGTARLPEPVRYDEELEETVRRFQERHGLLVDGIVGPETIGALNVAPRERTEVIALNMDRWRRVPVHEGRHVRVNIPEFTLRAMRGHDVDLEMRVVVGARHTPTPVFGEQISYLEFSPDWNVPDRIARADLIPRIARDPGYLSRMDFEVVDGWDEDASVLDPSTIDWAAARTHFPYRLRQRPGSENAMGLVKFMFPNEYVVYLHDTPATHRFEARQRTFSNGCVRVAKPEALAEWLLDDASWGADAVRHAMHDGQREVVLLDEEVPVELRYFTAWVDSDGAVQFRPDIYGRDEEALERHTCPRTRTDS